MNPWDYMELLVPVKDVCKLIRSYIPAKCFHCKKELTFKADKNQRLHYHRACYKKLYDQDRERCQRCHGFRIKCCMRKCPFATQRCETCPDRRDFVDEFCAGCFEKTKNRMQQTLIAQIKWRGGQSILHRKTSFCERFCDPLVKLGVRTWAWSRVNRLQRVSLVAPRCSIPLRFERNISLSHWAPLPSMSLLEWRRCTLHASLGGAWDMSAQAFIKCRVARICTFVPSVWVVIPAGLITVW